MAADLTAVILTRNETKNLPNCLAALQGWVSAVVVVDSGSTDDTVAIARQAGATVLPHPYDNAPAQWNWALQAAPVSTNWVLALDADQRVTPALRDQILTALPATPPEVAGYYVERHLIFRGRRLRWGGCTRPMLKLFRTGQARCDEREAPDMRFFPQRETRRLSGALLEDNMNERDLVWWASKQQRFARQLAVSEWDGRLGAVAVRPPGAPDQRVLWRKRLWVRLPRYIRPPLYFLYRYVALGGFLDGWPGLLYHAVQGFWLRWQVDVILGRLRRERR